MHEENHGPKACRRNTSYFREDAGCGVLYLHYFASYCMHEVLLVTSLSYCAHLKNDSFLLFSTRTSLNDLAWGHLCSEESADRRALCPR